MAYTDQASFVAGMSGKRKVVPCMKKQFGVSFCPDCARANELYRQAENGGGETVRKEASSVYFKRQYFCYGIIWLQGAPQNGKVCLVHIPTNQFKKLMEQLEHPTPAIRWPNPDTLDKGHLLVLGKYKKDAQFNDYKLDLDPNPNPLTEDWWEKTRPSLPNISDPVAVYDSFYKWPASNIFIPANDMEVGQYAQIRVLPNINSRPGTALMPFAQLSVHYVEQASKWDTLWREANWNVDKYDDIMAQCKFNDGMAQPASAGGYIGGIPSGVNAPGLGNLMPQAPAYGGPDQGDEVPF